MTYLFPSADDDQPPRRPADQLRGRVSGDPSLRRPIMKPCGDPGCNRLAPEGKTYCKRHDPANHKPTRPDLKRPEWVERSRRYREAHPVCEYVDPETGERCTRPAESADHITPVALGGDPDGPIRSLCRKHNGKVTGHLGQVMKERKGTAPPRKPRRGRWESADGSWRFEP